MSTSHQSPAYSLPSFRQKQLNTTTWGTGGNTCTIKDSYVFPNSYVDVTPNGTTPPNGRWAVSLGTGQFTITSSDAESSTLSISYVIL